MDFHSISDICWKGEIEAQKHDNFFFILFVCLQLDFNGVHITQTSEVKCIHEYNLS